MDQQQEAINAMALARMGFYHMAAIIELVNRLGSATWPRRPTCLS